MRRLFTLILLVAFVILLAVAIPSVRHLLRWREHSRLAQAVKDNIASFQDRAPDDIPEAQWSDAVDWTSNLISQVYFAPEEQDPNSLRNLSDALEQRLNEEVSLGTLRWIWDECEKAPRPGAKYAIQFRDVRLLTPEPIADQDLPKLWSLDRCLYLNLDNTEVTDRGLAYLQQFSNLKYLSLRGTSVTEQGVADLQTALPACEIHYREVTQRTDGSSLRRRAPAGRVLAPRAIQSFEKRNE